MVGCWCVFEFPRRSVNGKHEAFLEWDLRFQIIPAAYCGRGLSGNLVTFRNALIPWLIQELDKQNLQGKCSSDTKLLPVLFSFFSHHVCSCDRKKRYVQAKESETSLLLPVFLPLHRAAGVSAARVFCPLAHPCYHSSEFQASYIVHDPTSGFIIQQIVTLSKYGHDALDICHP